MNLLELRQKRGDIVTELKAIAKASELAKRPFSADERARITTLRAEDDKIKADAAALEAEDADRKFIADLNVELDKSGGRHTDPAAGQRLDPSAAPQKIPVNPWGKLRKPDGKLAAKGQEENGLGRQLQAIAMASMSGSQKVDNRLVWQNFNNLTTTGAGESAPSDGGFLVNKDFSTELLRRTYEYGEVLNRVRGIPISENANGLKINAIDETSRANGSRWGGVQVFWANEGDQGTAKKPKFRQMELNLKKLIGLAYATDELLADAAALEAVFMQAFTEEFSFVLEDTIFNGSGAGQMQGILNSPALVSITKETGQVTKTIVKENIDKMWSRCWGRSRANAVWFINQDTEPQLHSLSQVVGVGGVPVYLPPNGLSGAPFGQLYGRPVVPVEYCATLGTVGDVCLFDLSQYLMIDKGRMQSASSIHVRFINDEMTYRFLYRTDGQSIWNSVLTPKNGSNTLSPFVVCATR